MGKRDFIRLLTPEQEKEFSMLIHRHLHGQGEPLSPLELKRYDDLLTLKAREDYANWKNLYPGTTEEEMVPGLKIRYERDCFG